MALNFPQNPTNGDTYTVNGTTWEYNGTVWNITISQSGGSSTFLDLTDTPENFGTSGQVVAVNSSEDGLEFVSSGDVNQNAFSNIAVSGQTSIEADSITDTLTVAAGTGISITTDAETDTVTISNTETSSSNFSGLTESTTASLTIDKLYEPAIAMLRVDNNGTSSYTFTSHYGGTNPTIYALAGTTIAFDLSAIPGHPFEIQDALGDPYNTGLVHVAADGTVSTGADAQGKDSGTLYWRISESISGGYRYQCQNHASMVGGITVKRLSVI